MSRTSRMVITTLFLAGAVAACESKKDETSREEVPAEPTMPAQTTRSETTPPAATTPTTPPATTTPTTPSTTPGTTTPTTPQTGAAPTTGEGMGEPGKMGEMGATGKMGADMSDAQIAAITSMANKAEIDTSKLALSKTKNADVKRFAEMMVKDHSAAEDKAKTLLQKLDVSPEEGDMSRQMKTELDTTSQKLQGLTGAEFDKAYIADQVKAHQNVLDHLDKHLITSADSPELKSHLDSFRKTIAAHLDEAKKIETKMK